MRCEAARAALSVAMDELTASPGPAEFHARTCQGCRRFMKGAWRIRELSRFHVAPPVPDLVAGIMARVRDEADRPSAQAIRRPAGLPWSLGRHGARAGRGRRVVALSLAAGIIVGFVLTGGGLISVRRANTQALAEEIPRRLAAAASGLRGYGATFDITEMHWASAVPRRTFVANLSFREPEDFRVRVRDTTRYPSAEWPRNDLFLASDGRTWRVSGPNPCPRAALPGCPEGKPADRTVVNRPPFDAETAMPTDVIVPMTMLAASDRVNVVGLDRVAGRDAVAVELAYRDSTPLFRYLEFLGSWRPFFPDDRVVVSLDERTWFPLEYRVFPASGSVRALWSAQQGLPSERPGQAVFIAAARSLSTTVPATTSFSVRPGPGASDDGFRDLPLARLDSDATAPPRPRTLEGLRPARYGEFQTGLGRPFAESIAAYSRGLAWLTVTRVEGWDQRAPFGVGQLAQPVVLPGNTGVGYYEPASMTEARRLAIHTNRGEILVVSDLPRSTLLRVAASLPITGLPQPVSWRVHRWPGGSVEGGLTADLAMARAGFPVLVPTSLPEGYATGGAEVVRSSGTVGLTIVFRRPAAELDGDGIVLYEAKGQGLPPPTGADQVAVSLRGTIARWSAEEDRLEWIERGTYFSLGGPGLGLGTLLQVARSLSTEAGA